METASNLNSELDALEHQRQLLQKLAHTTQSLEVLRVALQASSDEAEQVLPAPYNSLFKDLDNDTRNLSDPEALLRLEHLDVQAVRFLQPILAIIQADANLAGQSYLDESSESFNQKIDEFRRLAETTLAMRVMLHRRGVDVPAFEMPIGPGELKQHLLNITKRENSCRNIVMQEMSSMHTDLSHLLASPGCTGAIQDYLRQSLEGLQQNLTHLKAGHSIKSMPMGLELVDLSSEAVLGASEPFVEIPVESVPANEPEPDVDVVDEAEGSPAAQNHSESVKLGFWKKLWIWLSTPANLKWKDIDKR